jgi:hypothetical protein
MIVSQEQQFAAHLKLPNQCSFPLRCAGKLPLLLRFPNTSSPINFSRFSIFPLGTSYSKYNTFPPSSEMWHKYLLGNYQRRLVSHSAAFPNLPSFHVSHPHAPSNLLSSQVSHTHLAKLTSDDSFPRAAVRSAPETSQPVKFPTLTPLKLPSQLSFPTHRCGCHLSLNAPYRNGSFSTLSPA